MTLLEKSRKRQTKLAGSDEASYDHPHRSSAGSHLAIKYDGVLFGAGPDCLVKLVEDGLSGG